MESSSGGYGVTCTTNKTKPYTNKGISILPFWSLDFSPTLFKVVYMGILSSPQEGFTIDRASALQEFLHSDVVP